MVHLIWFRNDLRVADNTSVAHACSGERVLAVYCFEPKYFEKGNFGFKKTERYRAKFLVESVAQLRENLDKLNIPLFVYHEAAGNIIPKLVDQYNVQHIYLQKEWTRDELNTLGEVRSKTPSQVEFHESFDQFLFHPDDIPYGDYQQLPKVFTAFRKKCEKLAQVRPPMASPEPKMPTNRLENDTSIPSLSALGLEDFERDPRTAFPFQGGELEAMDRVQEYFWDTKKLAYYKKTRNGLLGKDYSSKLSAWLANGSISARQVYAEVKRFEKEIKKNKDTYWLVFELIWRDFFKYVSLKHGPKIFQLGGILDKEYSWKNSKTATQNWIAGTTKEAFVNANMLELASTGWMSNRGRQNVASFWSKELEQDWRIGAAYFESMLIDYDVHSNWGNWMYNSGVGNDPRDRKFNIQRQAERYDAEGKFQRRWLQNTLF